MMIYLANASAGLRDPRITQTVTDHLRDEAAFGAPVAEARAEKAIHSFYENAARLINAHTDEVAFVESANRGLRDLINSIALKPGDRVVVDQTAWGGILAMLSAFPDLTIDVIPSDENGRCDLEQAASLFESPAKALLLTWAPSTNGILNPAEELITTAKNSCDFTIVDAAQVAGQIPIDVQALGCDALAMTGRKWLCGPRGSGIIYASKNFLEKTHPTLLDQSGLILTRDKWVPRKDAKRFETGERNIAGLLGLGAAIGYALNDTIDERHNALQECAGHLRDAFADIKGVTTLDGGDHTSAIVSIAFDAITHDRACAMLAEQEIITTPKNRHYAPLDMDWRGLAGAVRFAPHWTSSIRDLDHVISVVETLASQ